MLEEIEEQQKQLDCLCAFALENADLINLVRRLPDDLHHQIMVPFGKAAFFPGHLVHTNKFLVLLGEGYYADCMVKQTVGVLTRRGQALESNTEALHAAIADLKARADFFGAIARDSVHESSTRSLDDTCISKTPKAEIGWGFLWVIFLGLAAVGIGAYAFYKYRIWVSCQSSSSRWADRD